MWEEVCVRNTKVGDCTRMAGPGRRGLGPEVGCKDVRSPVDVEELAE